VQGLIDQFKNNKDFTNLLHQAGCESNPKGRRRFFRAAKEWLRGRLEQETRSGNDS
jgi:hypothetical protein